MSQPRDDDVVTPSLSEVIHKGAHSVLGSHHTTLVARVESYNSSKNEADVKPVWRQRFNDGEYQDFPVIPNCPVAQLQYGDWCMKGALKKGQEVLVLVAERSIDEWYLKAQDDVEPLDPRRFDLQDALVLPAIQSQPNALSIDDNSLIIGKDDGSIQLKLNDDGTLSLGSQSVDLLTLLDDLMEIVKTAVTATASGPQTISPPDIVKVEALQTKLGLIKE